MPLRLSEIIVHVDWESSHGELRLKYNEQIDSPYGFAPLAQIIPPPERLESSEEIKQPFFGPSGSFKVVPEIGNHGLYMIRLRPHYRLRSLIVEPEEVVVDLHANANESITYTFYNPTRRSSIVVSGHLAEDIEGFYRKLTAYPDDAIWRQSLVRRSFALPEGTETGALADPYPSMMTAEQLADYLQVAEKTVRKWTSENKIPHSNLGGAVRFRKEQIDAAIADGSIGVGRTTTTKSHRKCGVTPKPKNGA